MESITGDPAFPPPPDCGKSTPDQDAKAFAAGTAFANRYSQFVRSESNAQTMARWMEENNVDATRIESYVQAFETLVAEGKLAVRDGYTELSGESLAKSPRLRVLLQPQSRPLSDGESADAFYAAHRELHPGKPYWIRAREQQMQQTQEFFDEAAKSTIKGSVVNVTDYQHEQNGVPPLPDKASFRMKVRSMSAAELARRCAADPAFKAALDVLDD